MQGSDLLQAVVDRAIAHRDAINHLLRQRVEESGSVESASQQLQQLGQIIQASPSKQSANQAVPIQEGATQ